MKNTAPPPPAEPVHDVARRGRPCRQRGFTLLEVVLALSVFLMMTLMFAAAMPAIIHMGQYSSDYNQAVQLAQHKAEELRTSGLSNPDAASLGGLGIIDSPQPSPGAANPPGSPSGAFSYTFTTVDSLAHYYPPGCQGVLTISPDSAVAGADDVIITLTWQRAGQAVSSFALRTKIVNIH